MSLQARQDLVNKLVFQRDSEKSDLMDPNMTQTTLIALLLDLVNKGHHIEITAIRTDHSDDSSLGLHCHHNGYCADLWPLAQRRPETIWTQVIRTFDNSCETRPLVRGSIKSALPGQLGIV